MESWFYFGVLVAYEKILSLCKQLWREVLQCPGYVICKLLFSGKSELWGQFAFSSVLALLGVGHDIKLGWCCG